MDWEKEKKKASWLFYFFLGPFRDSGFQVTGEVRRTYGPSESFFSLQGKQFGKYGGVRGGEGRGRGGFECWRDRKRERERGWEE